MYKYLKITVCFFCLFILSSCASKRFAKKALEFEQAGLYTDAADFYYRSATRNAKNVEAKLGLRKTGQIVLDEKLDIFYTAYKNSRYKEAVGLYMDAQAYVNKLNGAGVRLTLDESYLEYFNESKDYYLEDEYVKAMNALNREDFKNAEILFAQIIKVQPNYKDAATQYTVAKYEPDYRNGISQMQQEKYRSAYYTFFNINKNANGYRQSKAYLDEAYEKASLTVLIAPITARSVNAAYETAQIKQSLINELNKTNNIFVRIVDLSAVQGNIMYENTSQINPKAANLAGIKILVNLEVLDFNGSAGRVQKSTEKAYLSEEITKKNEAGEEITETIYHKTEYTDYKVKNTAWLKMNYQFVRTDDGSIIGSNGINLSNSDQVHYATYSGNYKKLVPGKWDSKTKKSTSDEVHSSTYAISSLQNLFIARKEPTAVNILQNKLLSEALTSTRLVLDRYTPEK